MTKFLGTGWEFPVGTDRTGAIERSAGERDIEASIRLIIGTAKGERVMRPTFGCGIHDYTFETINTTTLSLLERSVRDALVRWEPRIEVTAVEATPENVAEGLLLISVDYVARRSNTEANLVYPFYLTEA